MTAAVVRPMDAARADPTQVTPLCAVDLGLFVEPQKPAR